MAHNHVPGVLRMLKNLVQIFEADKWHGKCTFTRITSAVRRESIGNEKGWLWENF